jgi:glycosyltransferase involved in cell wall biosynthesis/serine acetyltransferase
LDKKTLLVISGLEIWSMGTGKGAQSLYQTLAGYAGGGWTVHFLTGNKGEDPICDVHPALHIYRFDLPLIKALYSRRVVSHLAKNLWWVIFQTVALLYGMVLARREKIDLFYGYDTLGVPCGWILAKIFRKSFISRFQGTTIGYFRPQKLWRLKYWDQILALKVPSDLLIMTNDGQEEDKLLKYLGVDMSRVKFWMNGINRDYSLPAGFDLQAFKSGLGLEPGEKVILTVNRLHKWKRIDRVIRAMPGITGREPRTRLVIVGEGEEYARLAALASRLKVAEKTVFAGSVAQWEVPKYLALADVFVSCNDSANIGNPLLEAMIAGKCIVTLNNGSTGELIKNNVTGMLVEMDRLDTLGPVIADLLGDKEKRACLGSRAKIFAERHFWTWQERMNTELALAGQMVERKGGSGDKTQVFLMSSVHSWDDPRIFHKEAMTLKHDYGIELHAPAPFRYREVDGVRVYGLKHYRRRLFRCFNWLRLAVRAWRSKARVFHFHDPELIPLGVVLKLLKRRKVVYDVHEHNYITIRTREWIPKPLRGVAACLVERLERACAGIFSGVITADGELAKNFSGARLVTVVRNFPLASFGQDYFDTGNCDGKSGKEPVVIYLGVMGKERGLETVLETMPLVREKIPQARCLLVGRVSFKGLSQGHREKLKELQEKGLIRITGQVGYGEVMGCLARCSVGWTPFPPIPKHLYGIGTKLTEYMAMALPVVASEYGEGAAVVRAENCGILVSPLDPADHARAVVELLADQDLAGELGSNGRKAFLAWYNWENQAAGLLEFYGKLLQSGETERLLGLMREDLARAMSPVAGKSFWVKAGRFIQKPGIWAVLGYRLGHFLYQRRCLPARLILMLYRILVLLPLKLLTGIEIYPETRIGSGFYIEHYGCIFIAPTAVIGRNCTIFQGVTVGVDLGGRKAGVIGNNVIICAGAKVIGDIVVGDNVVVGANTVVTRNVEDNVVVAGVPAAVIGRRD